MKLPLKLTSEIFDNDLVSHGFFGRAGGVSTGPYESLNCGQGSKDDPVAVASNRELCQKALSTQHLATLYQVHSAEAVYTTTPFTERPKADALVTDQPGLAIGILTADCIPVLFHDPVTDIVGAAHAGWRGALAGVLENCIALMSDHGARPTDIRASFGPCLRQDNFEVGLDLVEAFVCNQAECDIFFKPGLSPEKRQFDLVAFAKWRLSQSGLLLQNIDDVQVCTLGAPNDYYSYRFAKNSGLADYGRNLSAICLGD